MGIDFDRLTGRQRGTLCEALIEAFGESKELERFLVWHDFKPLEHFSAAGKFPDRVFDLVEELSRTAKLGKFMAAVLKERSKYPVLKDLESRLPAAESTPTEDHPREVWMVPHRRNPYFTAREDVLKALREALHDDGCAVVGQTQAISGLGGIGKTQTAVEYAYRHRDDYQAVLWIRGAKEGDLAGGFGEVAQALGLAVDDAEQQLAAVHRWMDASTSWLLVIDNADEPDLLKPYLPTTYKGHILLTSRASYFGPLSIPDPLRLNTLPPEEARAFLLRRAGRKAPGSADEQAAADLAHELGFLPLALEQAGAYIAAKQARFGDYLADYREFRIQLLERSEPETGKYPKGVEETWNLSFKEVECISRASGDVLRLSAFLSPERIPEELLIEGVSKLGSAISEALDGSGRLQLDELLEPLTRYSLVERHTRDRSYSVHPLVQDVVRLNLDETSSKTWEQWVIECLDGIFPNAEFGAWGQCARLLPHVQAFWLVTGRSYEAVEAAHVFFRAASYLHDQGRYEEAEPLYQRSLEIYEKALGGDHPSFAKTLNYLANLYRDQGRYEEAEPLFQRSLEITEKALGGDHSELATTLNNLATLYRFQGRYEEAEPLFQRSSEIKEKALGGDHPELAIALNNLANLYSDQGRYEEAEPLYQRSLEILEKALGDDHPLLATVLNNLATLYRNQARYDKAEPLFQRSLEIFEKVLGRDHPDFAKALNNLAKLYRDQGRYEEAEPLFQRSLEILEKALGRDHPYFAKALNNLAKLYRDQGRDAEADKLAARADSIRKKK